MRFPFSYRCDWGGQVWALQTAHRRGCEVTKKKEKGIYRFLGQKP
jgi:hypothetical protein